MNYAIGHEILNAETPVTVHFKKRDYEIQDVDLLAIKIISHYTTQNPIILKEDKTTQYYTLLCSWYYSLLKLSYLERNEEMETNEELEHFFQSFILFSSELSIKKKIDLLFRMVWHLRTLLFISKGDQLNLNYYNQVAEADKLTHYGFDVAIMEIGNFDRWAIEEIQKFYEKDETDDLAFQLNENLHHMTYMIENLSEVIKNGEEAILERDKPGLGIIAHYLLNIYKKQNLTETVFLFYLFSLSTLCFWFNEVTNVDNEWFLKNEHFQKELAN